MSGMILLPAWAAVLVGLLALAGAAVTLVGTLGLVRLPEFYSRAHAPSLGATVGTVLLVAASMLAFTALNGRPSVHELLIALFITVTTPAPLMMLARATLYRERIESGGGKE